jgi:hypothetical protein
MKKIANFDIILHPVKLASLYMFYAKCGFMAIYRFLYNLQIVLQSRDVKKNFKQIHRNGQKSVD